MAAIAMETAIMNKKIKKDKNYHSGLLAEQKLMKLDRNNTHIKWNEISQHNWNQLNKLCRSCHGNKKGEFKKKLDSFHQTSWNFVGISTVVCGRSWGLEGVKKSQNGSRCHGNQGAKNVKFTQNFNLYSNVSCHIHI